MKNLVTLICSIVIGFSSFAQKDEIKAIEKALKKDNFAAAKSSVMAAESLLDNMDDKTKAKFYFLKAKALYANGATSGSDFNASVQSLDDLKSLESKMGKLKYTEEANKMKTAMLQSILEKANKAYSNKKFVIASDYFSNAYKLSQTDTIFLYYAASTAVNAQDYDLALEKYLTLKNLGFTDIKMNYYATNKETGEEEIFSDKSMRDISLKSNQYTKPRNAKSKSKLAEIVKNIALIYVSQEENEKALAAIKDAKAQNPGDMNLLLTEANVHLKMGNRDSFKSIMEEATLKDPNNAELQYNLGVIAAESGDSESAKAYYNKAIKLDPTYKNAYTNLAVAILDGESKIVDEMNSLGNSSADNLRYDELKALRQSLYKEAVPFLEKALDLDSSDLDAARTLMNIYSTIGETDKFKAMKAKIQELETNAGN